MGISDSRYNELRGALLNMEAVIEETPVNDPSFLALLKVYQETRGTYLRYANEQFDKMAEKMKTLAGQLEQDLEQLKQNAGAADALNAVLGLASAVAGIVTTGGLGNVLTRVLA